MNLPNKLTTSRMIMTLGFLVALLSDIPYGKLIALLLFLLASVTDMLDGYYARKYNLMTDFGKLMDPLADKILISAAFISFVQIPGTGVYAWMAIVVVAREFAVTGLRLLALSKGILLGAHRWGKNKMISQVVTAGLILGFLAARELFPTVIDGSVKRVISVSLTVLIYVTIVLTAVTGILFLTKHREMMKSGI